MKKHDIEQNPWIFCNKSRPQADLRLFCFPFSGGGASMYRDWSEAMGDKIEVRPVQLPGRESRFREPRETNADLIVKKIVDVLELFQDKPFALFGYSLGAFLAFEVCRELRNKNLPMPVHLFVAAMRAPHTPSVHPPLSALPDDEFVQQIEYYYQPNNDAWHITELRDLLLPVLKDDFVLADNYAHRHENPLPCPIDVFAGAEDIGAPPELTKRWSEQTSNIMDYHMYPGGHFFIDTCLSDIQKIVRDKLQSSITPQ